MKQPERSVFEGGMEDEQVLVIAPQVRELTRSAGWTAYAEMLKGRRVQAREAALEDDLARVLYWKGFVAGLKEAEELPATVLAAAEGLLNRREVEDRAAAVKPRRAFGEEDDAGDTSF